MSNPNEFFAALAPVALKIASQTTMHPETLLCQFADETGWHAEGTWQGREGWSGKNNLAGISPNGQIADYANLDEFVAAYVSVITQDAFGFPAVLQANSIENQMIALGRSEWAGSRYDAGKTGRPGVDLLTIYHNYQQMIEDALNAAKAAPPAQAEAEATQAAPAEQATPETTNAAAQDYYLATSLNQALQNLGNAWGADEKGQDFYHAVAMQIRHYAQIRGIHGVSVGA